MSIHQIMDEVTGSDSWKVLYIDGLHVATGASGMTGANAGSTFDGYVNINNLSVYGSLIQPSGPGGGFSTSSEVLLSGNLTGAFSTPYVCRVTRFLSNNSGVGNLISLHLPANIQTNSVATTLVFDTALPVGYRPIVNATCSQLIQVDDNNVVVLGTVTISDVGVITIGVGASQNAFTNAGGCGLPADVFVSFSTSSNTT